MRKRKEDQTTLHHHVSTEMDRVTQEHQIRHDKEMEVVRELEMQLSKAEEKERSGAKELMLDHENAIQELKEAHQTATSTSRLHGDGSSNTTTSDST